MNGNAPTMPETADIAIAGRAIGPRRPPYVIAEVSANHGGDFARAERIIRRFAAAGADAVKFQLYTADALTLDSDRSDFVIQEPGLWQGERLFGLYDKARTPIEWFPDLFRIARDCNVTPFASVFDAAHIEVLEALEAPAYKIASFEAVDLALIAACAATGKPVIISTGLCQLDDIADAVEAFRSSGGRELALLRCNSAYPAKPEEADLATIAHMAAEFKVPIGFSDHTLDSFQAVAAVALGACIVEKHVIDAREPETPDSAFSCLPDQFAEMVRGCHAAFAARGAVRYGPTEAERRSLVFRRSLYAVRDIPAGSPFTAADVRSVRPGHGMAPKHLSRVLASRAARDIAAGEAIREDMLT